MKSHINNNQLSNLYDELRQREESKSQLYPKYSFGPINKNKDTILFEQIVHELINNYDKAHEIIVNNNGTILVHYNGQKIQLQDLVKNVHFSQLSIVDEDIQKYAKNKQIHSKQYPTHSEFLCRIKSDKNAMSASLEQLQYGEMLAIHRYTYNPECRSMQKLLKTPDKLRFGDALNTILHTAIASHGLNRLPMTNLPTVVRSQDDRCLDELMQNFKAKRVFQEKEFISTSYVPQDTFQQNKENVTIIYKNMRGCYIAALSQIPHEQEYLIPPSSQVRLTGYTRNPNEFVFAAEGANVLLEHEMLPKAAATGPSVVSTFIHTVFNFVNSIYSTNTVTQNVPSNVNHINQYTKISDKLGSNPGGVYKHNTTGDLYYLKFPKHPNNRNGDITKNELLASKLYKLAQVNVPDISLIYDKDNTLGVASKIEPTFQPAFDVNTRCKRNEINSTTPGLHSGMVIDAWLANWDVVGLTGDNIGIFQNPNTAAIEAMRIDVGGSLVFRAQGESKDLKNDVTELDTLRDKKKNAKSAEVFHDVSTDDMVIGGYLLSRISDKQICDVVEEAGLGTMQFREELSQKLIARKKSIITYLKSLTPSIESTLTAENNNYHYSGLKKLDRQIGGR